MIVYKTFFHDLRPVFTTSVVGFILCLFIDFLRLSVDISKKIKKKIKNTISFPEFAVKMAFKFAYC